MTLAMLPTIIDAPGQYVTRGGEVVTISAVSTRERWGCEGSYADGTAEHWHPTGRLFTGLRSRHEVVAKGAHLPAVDDATYRRARAVFEGEDRAARAALAPRIFPEVTGSVPGALPAPLLALCRELYDHAPVEPSLPMTDLCLRIAAALAEGPLP